MENESIHRNHSKLHIYLTPDQCLYWHTPQKLSPSIEINIHHVQFTLFFMQAEHPYIVLTK